MPGQRPPCEQNDWQTGVKTLPCRNFVAGGKYGWGSEAASWVKWDPIGWGAGPWKFWYFYLHCDVNLSNSRGKFLAKNLRFHPWKEGGGLRLQSHADFWLFGFECETPLPQICNFSWTTLTFQIWVWNSPLFRIRNFSWRQCGSVETTLYTARLPSR